MSEINEPVAAPSASAPPPFEAAAPVPAPATPAAPYQAPYQAGAAPIGKVRGTGACIGLSIVTIGIYTWYWYYKTHDEMKQHTGEGIGGPIALLLAAVTGIVMPFLTASEVGKLYERRGQKPPVSAGTGLWYLLLGWLFLVGAIVWFVKVNGALNDYWKSVGAQA
jgi:hypothetical protein